MDTTQTVKKLGLVATVLSVGVLSACAPPNSAAPSQSAINGASQAEGVTYGPYDPRGSKNPHLVDKRTQKQ